MIIFNFRLGSQKSGHLFGQQPKFEIFSSLNCLDSNLLSPFWIQGLIYIIVLLVAIDTGVGLEKHKNIARKMSVF